MKLTVSNQHLLEKEKGNHSVTGMTSTLKQKTTAPHRHVRSKLAIRPADSTDIPSLVQLSSVNMPYVDINTVWEIPWTWKHYHVVENEQSRVVGAGSLLPLAKCIAEIRGLVVAQHCRDAGIATAIVEHLLNCADAIGMNAVCVTRRPDFFRKFGFRETNLAWLDLHRKPIAARNIMDNSSIKNLAPRVAMTLAG